MQTTQRGAFVISLDFEQYWGMRDHVPLESYQENLLGARLAVPALLKLFAEHAIHATWATVGFLFFESREELMRSIPRIKPQYTNTALSPYPHLGMIGKNEKDDPFHFAPSLVRKIAKTPGQEIATHTLSHYYALESGQTVEAFKADLKMAIEVGRRFGVEIKSLVFPKNQVNPDYLDACREAGITSYRGDYIPSDRIKLVRLATLENLTTFERIASGFPFNIQGSLFFPPFAGGLSNRVRDELQIRRIFYELAHAAKHGQVFHLWWHPDNFGANLAENLARLRRVLVRYESLRARYGMENPTMGELADRLLKAPSPCRTPGLAEFNQPNPSPLPNG